MTRVRSKFRKKLSKQNKVESATREKREKKEEAKELQWSFANCLRRSAVKIPDFCRFLYRRFTVSWVSGKVAWVTFWISFKNFLWISH